MNEVFRVLLIEDQVRHQQIYRETLSEHLGVEVLIAGDSEAALGLLAAEHAPDLVLLDLEIPGTSGEQLLRQIRTTHHLSAVPVVVLTGHTELEKQMELLEHGADDFIEKGGPPEVLIARLKTQMRHKLALDRLEQLALDRDLFAAGVLSDIGSLKGAIVALCRQAKDALTRDPAGEKTAVCGQLDKLCEHASRLGAYASEVIQSVRDTYRQPVAAAQEIGPLLDWVASVLAAGDPASPAPLWHAPVPLAPVLADPSFLRLALLNIMQSALKRVPLSAPLTLTVTQAPAPTTGDGTGRRLLTTRICDNGCAVAPADLPGLFDPFLQTGDSGGFGLALVAKVVAKMGGLVRAEPAAPAEGTGLALSLDLPAT